MASSYTSPLYFIEESSPLAKFNIHIIRSIDGARIKITNEIYEVEYFTLFDFNLLNQLLVDQLQNFYYTFMVLDNEFIYFPIISKKTLLEIMNVILKTKNFNL